MNKVNKNKEDNSDFKADMKPIDWEDAKKMIKAYRNLDSTRHIKSPKMDETGVKRLNGLWIPKDDIINLAKALESGKAHEVFLMFAVRAEDLVHAKSEKFLTTILTTIDAQGEIIPGSYNVFDPCPDKCPPKFMLELDDIKEKP